MRPQSTATEIVIPRSMEKARARMSVRHMESIMEALRKHKPSCSVIREPDKKADLSHQKAAQSSFSSGCFSIPWVSFASRQLHPRPVSVVLNVHCLVRKHGKTGLPALDFAGIHRAAIFMIWNKNGIFVCKTLPGDCNRIQYRKHQNHNHHKQ